MKTIANCFGACYHVIPVAKSNLVVNSWENVITMNTGHVNENDYDIAFCLTAILMVVY